MDSGPVPPAQRRPRTRATTKSSATLSIILHALVIALVFAFVAREGFLGEKLQTMFATLVPKDVPKEVKPPPPPEPPKTPEPPKNTPPPPPANTATAPPVNPATAAPDLPNVDAPPAVGGDFAVPGGPLVTRAPGGTGTGLGGRPTSNAPVRVVEKPPVRAAARSSDRVSRFETASRAQAGKTEALLDERKNQANVGEAIGSEAISRAGGNSAADVVTRISGVSVVEGKHAVIRGLADRYNLTTLNGGEVPSADPYRRSVPVDIFSTKIIEKIVTTKTFTPDLPGGFAGANIDIVTKSFPVEPFFEMSYGMSYNSQASLNPDFLVLPGTETSWATLGPNVAPLPGELRDYPPTQPYPSPPLPATRRETSATANQRRAQANEVQDFLQTLGPTGFEGTTSESPLNQNIAVSAGQTTRLFDRLLGMFAGFNLANNYSYYDNGVQNRYDASLTPVRSMSDTRANSLTDMGANVNLAYQLAPEHELEFNFLFNRATDAEARIQVGQSFREQPDDTLYLNQLHYTQRELYSYQVKGTHTLLDVGNMRIDWLVGLASTEQDEPDYRFFNFYRKPDGQNDIGGAGLPQPNYPARVFRTGTEDNTNYKIDDTIPFTVRGFLPGEFKFGLYSAGSERDFLERVFLYQQPTPYLYGDPNGFLTESNLSYVANQVDGIRTNYTFSRVIANSPGGNNSYNGSLSVYAGYLMTDFNLTERLRLVGGARFESTDLQITGFNGINDSSSTIQQLDILPALGVIYNLTSNMNVRANYSETIARPTYREIADYRSYDAAGDFIIAGNPDLTLSSIKNYDLRWEWYPDRGDLLSVGLFYKNLKNAIEQYSPDLSGGEVTFINTPEATLMGIELEARKDLGFIDPMLSDFTVGANFSYIKSIVDLTPQEIKNKKETDPGFDDTTRPLFDTSPIILNADLTYSNPRLGTTVTINGNFTAQRLFIFSGKGEDIYEHPAPQLDVIIGQRLSRHWSLKLSCRNLLDDAFSRTYGASSSGLIYSSYTRGRSFGLSVTGSF